MVQLAPLLRAIPLLSDAHSARAAGSNDLVARQTFNPSDLPSQCQSPCQVINTLTNCESNTTCFCASSVGSELQQCMSCLVQAVPSVESEAQQAITAWNEACNGNLSLSGTSGGSSGSSGGSTASTGGSSGGSTGSSGGTVPAPTSSGTSSGSGSGSSSSNPLGAKSSGAARFAAYGLAVCIVAALAGAYATL